MHREPSRPDLLDRLGELVEMRRTEVFLAVLIVVSVLPYPGIEETLRPLFLVAFGSDTAIRAAQLARGRKRGSAAEWGFLLIDVAAVISFLPLEAWLGTRERVALRLFRLVRMLVLLRFARELARDVYQVLTRREQLQQLALVTVSVLALAFVSGVVLSELPHVDHDFGTGADPSFWDRVWWSFRQIESPDNLIEHLRVHPMLALASIGLTVSGVFIFSYLIGIAANVVDQVVQAERRRPVGYRHHSMVVGPVHDSELLVREFVRLYEKNRALRRIRVRELYNWLVHGAPQPRRHALPRMTLLGPREDPPDYLLDRGMRWVVYRRGEGADPAALDIAGARRAKRAILLAHAAAGHDADAITTSSLAAFRSINPTAHVFVEVLDSDNQPLVQSVGGEGTFPLDVPRFLGLFLCHHLIVPGIEGVLRDLLTASGCEFYTHVFVDPEERAALARLGDEELSFEAMARTAWRDHGIVLAGVFLGEETIGRLRADLIPVDRLRQWVNPMVLADDDAGVASLGARPGRVPVRALRGLIAVAETYLPVRAYGRALIAGRGATAAATEGEPGRDVAADVVSRIRWEARPLRRVLVVGYSPAAASLLRGLARFVPDIEVLLVLSARPDAMTSLEARIASLRLGLDAEHLPGEHGVEVPLERGGRALVFTHRAPDLASFAVRVLKDREPVDAAVFLSDPESTDRDARTMMRVLRFARALEQGDVPRGDRMHVLVELLSLARGERLQRHVQAVPCGFGEGNLNLTLISTEQIRNYFMVHSAFVPGVTALYDKLLGERGQEIVRLEVGATDGDATSAAVDLGSLIAELAKKGCVPFALDMTDGVLHLSPGADRWFDATRIRGIYAIADSDRLVETFAPQPEPHPEPETEFT